MIRWGADGQLGWGTDGMDSVWSEVVWHGSHGVVGCGRVRYESAVMDRRDGAENGLIGQSRFGEFRSSQVS
jgi:hypothetical protein